jgi:hypothetical protein
VFKIIIIIASRANMHDYMALFLVRFLATYNFILGNWLRGEANFVEWGSEKLGKWGWRWGKLGGCGG